MADSTCKNCGQPVKSTKSGRGNWARWCSPECRNERLERSRQERIARRGPCRIAGCMTTARSATADLCEAHYYQIRRRDANGEHPKRPSRNRCQSEDCNRLDIGRHGLCAWHYATRPVITAAVSDTWWGGTNVSYNSVHARVRVTRGKAHTHCCIDCGDPAKHWSYDYNDPDERVENGAPFGFATECYSPRCVPCHAMFDSEMNAVRAGV